MKKGTIFLIVTAAVAGLALLGTAAVRKAYEWADKITVKISGVGKPSLDGGKVFVPLTVLLNNPAPIAIPIDNFLVQVFLNTAKGWAKIASTPNSGALTINPGSNKLDVVPMIDLEVIQKSVNKENIVSDFKNFIKSGKLPSINLRFDAIATAGGIDIPVSFPHTLNLNAL